MQIVTVTPARTGADHYLEIAFTAAAGTLAAGTSSGLVQTAFHFDNFPAFDYTNDYSFNPATATLVDWSKVTLYDNGALVWGTEP